VCVHARFGGELLGGQRAALLDGAARSRQGARPWRRDSVSAHRGTPVGVETPKCPTSSTFSSSLALAVRPSRFTARTAAPRPSPANSPTPARNDQLRAA